MDGIKLLSEQLLSYPAAVSVAYYFVTIITARVLTTTSKLLTPASLHLYLGDFILSWAFHACSLENSMVRRHYGIPGYAIALFCLALVWALTGGGHQVNPRSDLILYLRDKATAKQAVLRVIVQLAGGLSSYHYARLFWALDMSEGYSERIDHCTSDLRVPLVTGLAVEVAGSAVDTFLGQKLFSTYLMSEMITKCGLGVLFTVYGVDMTGFYLNPVNATNQNWGCDGEDPFVHIFVYWIGPLVATAVVLVVMKRREWIDPAPKPTQNAPSSRAARRSTQYYDSGIARAGRMAAGLRKVNSKKKRTV